MSWFKKCQGSEPTPLRGNVMIECYDGSQCVDFNKTCDHEPHCADGSDEFMCTEQNLLTLIHSISPAIHLAEEEAAIAVQAAEAAEAAFADAGCIVTTTTTTTTPTTTAGGAVASDGSGDSSKEANSTAPLAVLTQKCQHRREKADRMAAAAERAANHEIFAKAAFKVAWRLLDQFEEGPSTTTMTSTTTTLYVFPVESKNPMPTGSVFAIILAVALVLVFGVIFYRILQKRWQEAEEEAYRASSAETRGVENPVYEAPVPGAGVDGNYLAVGGVGDDEGGAESGMESDEA